MSLPLESNSGFLYGCKNSLFIQAVSSSPLASIQTTMHNLTKLFCISRNLNSSRLSLQATSYFRCPLIYKRMLKMPSEDSCGVEFPRGIQSKGSLSHSQITADELFDYGRKLVTELIHQNTPEILQESELLRVVKSALGLSYCDQRCSKTDDEGATSFSWNDKDSIASAFWHFGEEKWKEAAEKISMYKPEKVIHDAVELVQERFKGVVANNTLVSHILGAGDYLTATKQSIKMEAEILSQLLCDRRDYTLACMTEFWKVYCENHTTLETLYSLMNDCVLRHIHCEGLELFSEYIWTSKPQYYDLDFLDMMNYPQIGDEGFHFIEEERVPRRSILYIGRR